MNDYPAAVQIEDEGLRDGLQIEAKQLTIAEKLAFIEGMVKCGIRRIQVGSFVHPKWVPQMADTDALFGALEPRPGVIYTALVLNQRGLERALKCGVRHLSMSISASETHSKKNTNRTIAESLVEARAMIANAIAAGITVRAGIQSALGCGFEGRIDPAVVCDIARVYDELGVAEINIADSAGLSNPRAVREVVEKVRGVVSDRVTLSLHLHDTRGLGIANLVAGIEAGVTLFDTALGGLGGCPFIPKAAGNIATEDVAFALGEMGIETGIDWGALCDLAIKMEEILGRRLPGRMMHLPRSA